MNRNSNSKNKKGRATYTPSNRITKAAAMNGYNPVKKEMEQSTTAFKFTQPLKRKNRNASSNGSSHSSQSNGSHSNNKNNNNDTKSTRPTFQFKIGLQVGVALGECFLQLQKLENSMDHLRGVSEDITDVMHVITPKNTQQNDDDPIEEIHALNENLNNWSKDASKRMKNVSGTIQKLHGKLEQLDNHHSRAQQHVLQLQQKDRMDMDKAYETINTLQSEIKDAKRELNAKYSELKKMKKSSTFNNEKKKDKDYEALMKEKLAGLEQKEKELDHDAEIIATQSEDLRKESERLLTERDEVRKQKQQWQKMIDEVKDQKQKLDKRESDLNTNHKKLLELHETLSEEKKKLHKKAKKIKAREKRLNALRIAQSQYQMSPNQYQHNQPPSSNGSDYAESELTYFSDGDTEIASVNSISDDESQDNYHKQEMQKLKHLNIPNTGMY